MSIQLKSYLWDDDIMSMSRVKFHVFAAAITAFGFHFNAKGAAGSCTPPKDFKASDMRKEFGPIRDQGSIGWCYAYGTSDLMGHWLQKNRGINMTNEKTRISAAAASMRYNSVGRSAGQGESDARRRIAEATETLFNETLDKVQTQRRIASGKLSAFIARDKRAQELLDQMTDREAKESAAYLENYKNNPIPSGYPGTGSGMQKPTLLDTLERQFSPEGKEIGQQILKLASNDPEFENEYKRFSRYQSEAFALNEVRSSTVNEKEGGEPDKVLEQLMSDGYCTEAEIPSEGYDYRVQMTPVVPMGTTYGGGLLGTQTGAKAILNESMKKYSNHPTEENLCEATTAAKQMFPKLNEKDIRDILEQAKKNDDDAVDRLLKMSCKLKKVDLPRPTVKVDKTKATLFQSIQESLAKGKPVGISYYAGIFTTGSSDINEIVARGEFHYSVLAGQRFNCDTGQVEYILRNSWGKDSCATNSSAILKQSQTPRFKCEDGYYIVPENTLKGVVLEETHLE